MHSTEGSGMLSSGMTTSGQPWESGWMLPSKPLRHLSKNYAVRQMPLQLTPTPPLTQLHRMSLLLKDHRASLVANVHRSWCGAVQRALVESGLDGPWTSK
jgi:hypothetical protein